MFTEVLVFILTTLLTFYLYSYIKINSYYKERGIKYMSGVPVLGNFLRSTLLIRHFWEDMDAVYKAFPDEKYVGLSGGTYPMILVRDPDLIKAITMNDFDHFQKHQPFIPLLDPLFAASVFVMSGKVWKDMRDILSSAFTSSKMKNVMANLLELGTNIVEYLKDRENEDVDLDVVFRRYTNDMMARAAFSGDINSFKHDNDLYKIASKLMILSFWQRIQYLALSQFPAISEMITVHFWGKKTTTFFRNLYKNTVAYRKKNTVTRPDMIQALSDTTKELTIDQLAGQILFTYLAGFDSTAGVAIMGILELTIHPEIQEKLYQEIKHEKVECLTYEKLSKLNYLNCVINETLRKWTPTLILDRTCTKAYDLPPPTEGGRPYRVHPGDVIYSAVNSIHWDPKYFPEPDKFRPERFCEENKRNINPNTFMPFGYGPRTCIGKRLALLGMQLLFYSLVLNYKIVRCDKTISSIQLKPYDFNIRCKGGSWVRFENRN